MPNLVQWFNNRKLERICLLLIGIMMGLLFWKLFSVLQRDFTEVHSRVENGTMINLNAGKRGESMNGLLKKGLYFEDPKDIAFISAALSAIKDDGSVIDNIGALNKKKYFVNADEAFLKGGRSFKKRALLSRNLLGFGEADSISFEKEKAHPLVVTSQTSVDLGKYNISGVIKNQDDQPASGVLVRLKLLVPQDSNAVADRNEEEKNIIRFKNGVRKMLIPDSADNLQLLSFNAYARTDASGKFIFSGLPENKSYEILPLQPGYEFGRSQGIEKLQDDASFHFVQSPHLLKLFSSKEFSTFKKEKAFIVRTP